MIVVVEAEEGQETLIELYHVSYLTSYPVDFEQVPFYTDSMFPSGERYTLDYDHFKATFIDTNPALPNPFPFIMKVRSIRNDIKSWSGYEMKVNFNYT